MPERLTDAELQQLAADQNPQPPPCPCGSPRIYEPCNLGFWVCERTSLQPFRNDADLQHLWLTRWKPPVTDPRVLAAVTELLERREQEAPRLESLMPCNDPNVDGIAARSETR